MSEFVGTGDGRVDRIFELCYRKEANEFVKRHTCCILVEAAEDLYFVLTVRLLRDIVVNSVC